jgi:hypothetical protein
VSTTGRLFLQAFVITLVAQLLSPEALGQEQQQAESTAEPTSPAQAPVRELEEITVRGELSIIAIRNQLERAEDNLYGLFNELNDDDDFDITCYERKRASYIPIRECEPRFLTRARQANAVTSMVGIREGTASAGGFVGTAGDFSATNGSPLFEFGLGQVQNEVELARSQAEKFEALQQEMLKLATENPAYQDALLQVGRLKDVLREERLKRFGIP